MLVFKGLFSIMYLNMGLMITFIYADISYFKPIEEINKILGTPFFMAKGY